MDHLNIYTVGGDTLILGDGVAGEQIDGACAEILKGENLHTQAGCVLGTAIQIPRMECAANYFSADCALGFGAYLYALNPEKSTFTVSTSGLNTPFGVAYDKQTDMATLTLAAKAKTLLTGDYPCVVFGECAYYVTEEKTAEQAQTVLSDLLAAGTQASAALLAVNGDEITPYFAQKNGVCVGFSAGSAALALAFLESEQTRDYFKKTYRFPKGERKVSMKRFLSEAFEATLEAEVKELG